MYHCRGRTSGISSKGYVGEVRGGKGGQGGRGGRGEVVQRWRGGKHG